MEKLNKKIRVRFAPSPTGEMHIGSARTALFNYLFAHHNDGKFVLRIEDTDAKRFVAGSVERLIKNLKWLGIEFDEGVRLDKESKIEQFGAFGPYIQSERLGIYQEYAMKLVEDGNAYYCFCSEERLKKMREDQEKKKIAPMYDRKCLSCTKEEIDSNIKNKKPYVIRLKIPYSGVTEFDDLIRGRISIDNSTIDDQILIKSDGMPTYHLANVVDDHLMEISHVLRAEEWLPSTPKHIILYNYFKWKAPEYGHIPLVLAQDKSKLSKRHGAVSVDEFRQLGYLPEALINYIALLGWNPKSEKEFFTLSELVKDFDVSNVNKSGAVFDQDKLNHFNHRYIQNMPEDELKEMLIKESKHKFENVDKIIAITKNRMQKLSDFTDLSKIFVKLNKYEVESLVFKKSTKTSTLKGLESVKISLENMNETGWNSIETINAELLKVVTENNLTNGDVFWPVRFALSGVEKSPSPSELLWVFGKTESLKRIGEAISKLSKI